MSPPKTVPSISALVNAALLAENIRPLWASGVRTVISVVDATFTTPTAMPMTTRIG